MRPGRKRKMGLINSALEERLREMEDKIALLEEALAPGKVMIPEEQRVPKVVVGAGNWVEEDSDGD